MSDEPKQTKDWTGEEKLRVVLEAMKTSVVQVCAKYAKHGLSEEQVQSWRRSVIERGGGIFEPKPEGASKPAPRSKGRKRSPFLVFVATFSILANLGVAALAAAHYFDYFDLSPWLGGLSPNTNLQSPPERSQADASPEKDFPPLASGSPSRPSLDQLTPTGDLSPRTPVTVPTLGGQQPPRGPGIVSEVEVCGARARGNKVVFVLDLNDYMRIGPNGEPNFERLRKEVRDAIFSLGEKTTFNVILLHGISRLHLFEDKLVYATDSKKREAYLWLSFPVWDVPKAVKARFGEPDLMVKPPEGVVGPWRAMSAALSFDPDLIYLLTGDCASLRADDFSSFELSGVKMSYEAQTPAWERWRRETSAVRLTIAKWLQSDSLRSADLEVTDAEIDNAVRQLGIVMPKKPAGAPDSQWPWKAIYADFKRSLLSPISNLAATQVIVSLPKSRQWPVGLESVSREFAKLSGGSFTLLDEAFFSSP
ncbi:MAG: hypothetical protein CMI32_02460 [Opitutales bacterium]|nr:hypothetical protein [Opitutales bacterium]